MSNIEWSFVVPQSKETGGISKIDTNNSPARYVGIKGCGGTGYIYFRLFEVYSKGPVDDKPQPPCILEPIDYSTIFDFDITICTLCSKTLCDPRILPCGHSFCLGDLQQLNKSDCPTCSSPFHSPPSNLPVNWIVNKAIQNKASQSAPESKIACHGCEDHSATLWCTDCNANFCHDCSQTAHSLRFMSSHKVISVTQKSLEYFPCPSHPEELCKAYCKNCQEAVCVFCVSTSHQDHKSIPLKDHLKQQRGELKELLQPYEVNNTSLSKEISELETELERIQRELSTKKKLNHELSTGIAVFSQYVDQIGPECLSKPNIAKIFENFVREFIQ